MLCDDARELGVKEQDHVQEQPNGRQHDSQPVVTFLARCVTQHEGPVRVIADIGAHLRCEDELHDDDEVETEAILPWHGVDQDAEKSRGCCWMHGWVGGGFKTAGVFSRTRK